MKNANNTFLFAIRFRTLAVVLPLSILLAAPSHAQTYTWDGGGADNFWNNRSNWVDDPATLAFTSNPTPNTIGVVFDSSSTAQLTNRLGAATRLNSLLFSNLASDVVISNVNTGGTVASLFFRGSDPVLRIAEGVSNAVTFQSGVVETGSNFTIDHQGSGLLTFNSQLRTTVAGDTGGVTKTGSGTMQLINNLNNFQGGLFIQGGAVRSFGAAGTFGYAFGSNSLGNAVVTLQGGALEIYRNGNSTFSNNVVVQSNATITSGRNAVGAGVNYTLDGTLTMGAQTLTINAANVNSGTAGIEVLGATTLTGNGTLLVTNNVGGVTTSLRLGAVNESGGSYGLTKAGDGLLTLTAAGNYSGGTTIEGGTLSVASDSFLGSGGDVSLGGGTWQITGSTAYNSARAIGLTADSTLEVTNTAGATFSGLFSTTSISNVLTKTGGGALTLGPGSGQTNELGVLVVNDGSTITLAGGTTRLAGSSPNSVGPGLQLRSGSLILDSGNLVTTNAAFSGVNGTTTLTIRASSSYTSDGLFTLGFGAGGNGTLHLDGGTMTVNSLLRTVAATASTTANATANLDGGTLALNGFSDSATLGGATVFFNGATVRALANNAEFANTGFTTYRVKSGGAVFDTDGRNITFGRALEADGDSPGGGLTKTGAGTLTLSGDNTFSGGTALGEGTLRLDHINAAGTGTITQSSAASTLQINTTGTVANAMSIYNISTLQTVTLSGNKTLSNATFTVAADTTTTESGVLSGDGGITKLGTGTLLVTASNTFTGTVDVQAGLLSLASATGFAAGGTTNVIVATDATLLIAQSDQVNNAAALSLSGGTIQRASGVSEVFGNLNVSSASFLDFGSGTGGTLSFGTYTASALLTVNNFFEGNVLTFGDDLSSSINNTNSFKFDNAFTSSWNQGTSTFTITAIPEPSTYVAAAGLLGLLVLSIRRRAASRSPQS